MLDSMSAGVSSLLPEESAECRFTASYRVPLYNGRYYFKVCLAAHPQDVDLSNDTLVRMAFCLHLDTVDVAVMDILYPVASDTLDAGFACGLKVRVSNTGNRDLRALPLHALVMDGKRVVKDTLEGIISGFGHGDTVDYMFPGSFRIPETAGDFYLKVFTDAVRVDLFRANDTIVRKRTCMRLSDTVDVHLLSVVSPSVTDTLFGGSSVSPSVCAAYNGNVRLPLLNMRMVVSDSSHRVLDSIPFTFLMAIQNGDTVSYVDNNNKSTDYESQKWVDTCMDLENAIMTDSFGVEANDCYRIPYIPDGLRQSVRLGYMYKNSYYTIKAEKIRYAFTVDSSNAILLLHYSFFLSVGHSFIRNDYDPQFGIYVRDTSGKTLYYYGVGAMDSGRYNVCRIRPPSVMNDLRIIYTPWKLSAVNLSPYIGKEVELIFYVSNCWQGTGMHFGLAYVVPECRPAKIDVQYCSSDKVARLSAPEGFAAYEWTDSSGKVVGSQQRLRIVGPADGSVYRCKMKPQIGYATYLDATIRRTFVDAGFALDCDTLGLKLHLCGCMLSILRNFFGQKAIPAHKWIQYWNIWSA